MCCACWPCGLRPGRPEARRVSVSAERVPICAIHGRKATAGSPAFYPDWLHDLQPVESIADIVIPDTPLARDVTEFIREAENDLLFDHSRRVFLFGALRGRRRGLQPDLELLYVGAMFHDIGLTDRYRSSELRFEVDGANAACEFLRARGVDEADARKVWLGIATTHHTGGDRVFGTGNRPGDGRCRNRC